MIKLLDRTLLDTLVSEAASLPRRRKNLNLHSSPDEPVQKLFNAMQADSYVRPHRHSEREKTELFLAVRGRFAALIFDEQGRLTERRDISAAGEVFGAEIRPGTWHTVIAVDDGAVFLEVKQGPYTPLAEKDFAPWAPAEHTTEAAQYLDWLRQAQVGEQSPSFRANDCPDIAT